MAIVEENFPRGGKSRDVKRERPANEKKWKNESLFKVKRNSMIYKIVFADNITALLDNCSLNRNLLSRKSTRDV
jgi:hypothetical protein